MGNNTDTPYQHTNGTGLPDSVRTQMESSFGTDLSSVRVHPNSPNVEPGARAYTQGNDIHFGPGQYAPGEQASRQLLGHELAHVVQQRSGSQGSPADAQLAGYAAAGGQTSGMHGLPPAAK
jgi:hypothetical protein